MPRIAKQLSALEIKRLDRPGYHSVGGVPGLTMQVTASGAKSWVMRASVAGRRREIGLGAYPTVSLAAAYVRAREVREQIFRGEDPLAEKRAARMKAQAVRIEELARAWTFQKCAEAYIASKAAGWKSDKHAKQWAATLTAYAYPKIGKLSVQDVALSHVMAIVEPDWTQKTETINRVRNRIELVLDWAAVRGFRSKDNPARWRGNLDKLLPAPSKVAPVKSHKALPTTKIPTFMSNLRGAPGMAARCLEFVVLTACRSGEARLATWDEIDWDEKTWSIPGARMKSGRPHRVPLSLPAAALLKALPRLTTGPSEPEGGDRKNFIFPGSKQGTGLSDMALLQVMRRLGVDAVPHGFRSSFSSWCASETDYPFEVREMALAHTVGDATVSAYQRSDLFEKRRQLMTDWALVVGGTPQEKP